MSTLRKSGKEKLHFKIMNNNVANSDFKHLKDICLECLNENADIAEKLDLYYKDIQVIFFYKTTDKNVGAIINRILNDQTPPESPKPTPAFSRSRSNVGIIAIFTSHLMESIKKRTDIKDVEGYIKNGIFEEFCHLVEQKGDSSMHPNSYWLLWGIYRARNLLLFGNEIIAQLDTDRNHYEVYSLMLKAYPNDWVKRYSSYNSQKPEEVEQQYQKWKISIPINVAHARLVTDFLRTLNFQYVLQKALKEKLTQENTLLLTKMIEVGKKVIETRRRLIETEIGLSALALIDSLDESVFKSPETFFAIILDLWRNLRLI